MTEELENGILQTPPSYEAFVHSIGHHSGDTARVMQGLTYAMMKAWSDEVMRTVYVLRCRLWTEKMVPDWWRYG